MKLARRHTVVVAASLILGLGVVAGVAGVGAMWLNDSSAGATSPASSAGGTRPTLPAARLLPENRYPTLATTPAAKPEAANSSAPRRVTPAATSSTPAPDPTALKCEALDAYGNLADEAPERAVEVTRTLIGHAQHDPDEEVRAAALWAIRGQHADLSAVENLGAILVTDRSPAVRQAAAEALADAAFETRGPALAALVAAIERERDGEVKRSELSAIVRAGRAAAIPALEAIAGRDAELSVDARDWVALLERGEVDMEKLWEEKQRREDARGGPRIADED